MSYDQPDDDSTQYVQRTANMLSKLQDVVGPRWLPLEMTEDTFTINVYDPISAPFLSKLKDCSYHGNDKELAESKIRKLQQQRHHVFT